MQPVDSGCLSSDMTRSSGAGPQPTLLPSSSPIIDLRGLRALLGQLAPLPCHLWPDRLPRPSQHRDQGSASKASCPLPATWCSISDEGYISFSIPSTLYCPSANRLRTWSVYSSSLWSASAASSVAHTGREGERSSPSKQPHNHTPIWCEVCFWFYCGLRMHSFLPGHHLVIFT